MEKFLIKPVILFLSRRDWSLEKIRKLQKKILIGFSIFFTITVLRFEFGFNNPNFSVSVSADIPFLIIEMVLFTLYTMYLYYYFKYFDKVKEYYLFSLLSDHKQVVCAYHDKDIENKVYKIEKIVVSGIFGTTAHIHIRGDEHYYFDDWRAFKFVGVKESRKLKLQQLKNIMK